MKQLLTACTLVLLSIGVASAQPASAKPAGSVAQTLMDLEKQWTAAAKASNGAAIGALLADDFVTLDSDGTMHTKAETVARASKAKWTVNEIGDLKVTVHGDTAIVSGWWTGNGSDGAGKTVSNAKERWVDTWKMANGKWQCIASAGTAAPK
jgi:ketosteroid isomerase-like protein